MLKNKMIKRKVAIILFHTNGTILIQDRKEMSKHGEEYGFFGGKIEENENPEQALKREIKEELGIDIKGFKLIKSYHQIIPEINREITRNVFLAQMPDIKKNYKILDLCCGPGTFLVPLTKKNYNIEGIDFSKQMLKQAKKFAKKKKTQIKINQGDATNIKRKNNPNKLAPE